MPCFFLLSGDLKGLDLEGVRGVHLNPREPPLGSNNFKFMGTIMNNQVNC